MRVVRSDRVRFASLLLVVGCLVFTEGCDGAGGDEAPDSGTLSGLIFYEGKKSEMGMGPEGPIAGYALLQFSNDTQVYWYHSDLADFGTYRLLSETELEITFKYMFGSEDPADRFSCVLEENGQIVVCEFGTFYARGVHPDEEFHSPLSTDAR